MCIYIYVCALYIPILQTCYRAPEGLYIYIPAMGWGSPEFPDQQRYNSRLLKAWMPAAVGDMTWPFWQSIRSCWFHQISPVMHVPQKRTPHNPQQTEIISNIIQPLLLLVLSRNSQACRANARSPPSAQKISQRTVAALRAVVVLVARYVYRYVSMMEWRENEKSLKVLNHTSPWFSYVLLFRESRFRRCQIWALPYIVPVRTWRCHLLVLEHYKVTRLILFPERLSLPGSTRYLDLSLKPHNTWMIHHESTNVELPSAFSAFVEFWTDTTFFQVILQRVWWFEASWMVRKDKRERLCSLHVGGDAALSATWRSFHSHKLINWAGWVMKLTWTIKKHVDLYKE